MLNKEQKAKVITDLKDRLSNAQSVVLVDYKGISVADDTILRRKLRESNVEYAVVKNTLMDIAMKELGYDTMSEYLSGPTAMAISDDPVAPAKTLYEYSKTNEHIKFISAIVQGKIIGVDDIENLAQLPPREELIAKALGSMKSPITNLVYVLNGTISSLVYALNAVKEKKSA